LYAPYNRHQDDDRDIHPLLEHNAEELLKPKYFLIRGKTSHYEPLKTTENFELIFYNQAEVLPDMPIDAYAKAQTNIQFDVLLKEILLSIQM